MTKLSTSLAALMLTLAACGPAAATPASQPAVSSPASPIASAAAKTSASAAASAAAKAPASGAVPGAAKPAASGAASAAAPGDVAALYEAAKKEGEVVFYGSLNTQEAEPILKAFEKRYPGVKTTDIRASSEKLVQRFATEAKAGKVLADVLETNAEDWLPVLKDGLITPYRPPEAAALSDEFKGKDDLWFADRVNEIVIQCNTDKVPVADCHKLTWESLTDPKWKDQILIEQADVVWFQTLAKHKYQSDDKALQFLKAIAANNPQLQSGHTETSELLVGGKRSVFATAYLHRVFTLQEKKAPTDWAPTEAILLPILIGQPKGAPHPNAGKLLQNWMMSKEGAEAGAAVNRAPARRDVKLDHDYFPKDTKFYAQLPDDVEETSKYLKIWNETFGLR